MASYWIVYRDIEDHEPRQFFEVMAPPETDQMVVQSGLLPGLFGAKDLYIQWYHRQVNRDTVHLVAYTHQALKAHEVKDLVVKAYQFAKERN